MTVSQQALIDEGIKDQDSEHDEEINLCANAKPFFPDKNELDGEDVLDIKELKELEKVTENLLSKRPDSEEQEDEKKDSKQSQFNAPSMIESAIGKVKGTQDHGFQMA